MLQGRNFSYADTQRHRLGPNYQQLPVNRSTTIVRNVNQEGLDGDHGHTKGDINYEPSSLVSHKGRWPIPGLSSSHPTDSGPATQESLKGPQDFRQAGDRIRGMSQEERDHLMNNFKGEFAKVKDKVVLIKFIGNLYRADANFGTALAKTAGVELESVMKLIAKK